MLDTEHQNAPVTVGPPPTDQPKLPGGVIVPPPQTHVTDFPASIAVAATVLGCVVLLLIAGRFDKSGGALTISLLIVLTVVGVLAFSVLVTVPRDETTAALVGALTAAFGGVITYWLRKRSDNDEGGDNANRP
jgi:FtsH-binding integral membrane protein